MLIRLLSSAAAGLAITAGLFYLMHYLIEISEAAVDPRPPLTLAPWGTTIDDTPLVVDEKWQKRIDDPAVPPPVRVTENYTDNMERTRIPLANTVPGASISRLFGPGMVDSGLMTVVTVRPSYPAAASRRGIEGHVIVEFDVTRTGTVSNVVVFETSNRIFNRSAINAAKKFRFKPKVVDGVAQMSVGVRRLFTFEMETE